MNWYSISDGEFLFNRNMRGLGLFVRLGLYLLIFSPLLFCGYLVSTFILQPSSPGHEWLIAILVFAVIIYVALFFFKSLVIGLKRKGSLWWIPIFLFCIAFTCALPMKVVFSSAAWLTGHNAILTWSLDILFGIFVYSRYDFLNHFPQHFGRRKRRAAF